MKSSRSQSQLKLPPMEVRKTDSAVSPIRHTDRDDHVVRISDRDAAARLAAQIFSEALAASKINRDEAAALVGVSRSLIDKMCEATGKSPSLLQIVLLGPVFHVALLRELDKHFGLGRAVLAQVQQSVGALALLVR
jgi:hypothetical protein